MHILKFIKMHGLGNDFILVKEDEIPSGNLNELSKFLCNRRFGIGADQLLILGKSEKADFKMRIFNSGGGEVEMCGNGIRCLAKYIWDAKLSNKNVLDIETLAGIRRPERAGDQIKVDMGRFILEARDIPVNLNGKVMDYPLKVDDREFEITCVSMGNPHAVIFVENVSEFPVGFYGPKIENHQLFPKQTNVEFIEVMSPSAIKMRVWERGAGETLACGTGAAAAVVASNLKGLTGEKVKVILFAGDLIIELAKDAHVYMTGPAEEVFEGSIEI